MKYVIGYILAVCGLLIVSMSAFGFAVTLQGFLLIHVVCSLAGLLLWGREEQQWRKSFETRNPAATHKMSGPLPANQESTSRQAS
jgi:hypothetical protein